ncbi:zinc finger protein 397-like isoform X2 [Littorina saxatilis]|uniref:C2H2-type domain-containing protein n=2 Tax=Littorina saxatilis TaxID=31220 RepID=A0AAN9C0J1_9CAEN
MESVDDEFLCGECQEKFISLPDYLLHKIQHIEMGKPGGCPLCGISFSRQVALREHLDRKHNIPRLKTDSKNGKRRGRPRKDPDAEICSSQVTKTESDTIGVSSSEQLTSESEAAQSTMHIIIDKIGDGELSVDDLSKAVLQADPSVAFPSSSATVMVETSDMGDLRHLVEHVNAVTQEDALQTQPTSQPAQADTSTPQHSLQQVSQDEAKHKQCSTSETDTTLIPESNRTSISLETETNQNLSTKESTTSLSKSDASLSKGDPESEPDFLFVLLTSHVKRKSLSYSKQSFKCFHCDFKTSWRRSLVKHMGDNHDDHLAIHQCITVHNSKKLQDQQVLKMSDYAAALSRQRRQVNSQRVRGVEKQDLPGRYHCTKCDKVFGRLRYLRKHQVIHRSDKRYLCDDCGKAFKTKAYLAAHRQTHQTRAYRCSQCDFTSSVNALIHAHRQLHNDHCVICEVCGSAYNDRATLRKHKQVHDESRPYPCTYPGCTWRFKTEVMCRAHVRGHTTQGRFVCSVCNYVFRHKHHLQRHLAKIHSMDEASVYHTTCSSRKLPKGTTVKICEEKQLMEVVQEEQPLADTVNLIVNSGLSEEQLQSMLESGQFVIATDDNDSSVNYEVANITMNVTYDTLGESGEGVSAGQTILIPHDAECSQIIFQQETEPVSANVET